MPPELAEDITDDAALGGRLRLLQPRRGHRFGHDAILLAAATPAQPGDLVVDLGAGVGTAGLAVAARIQDIKLALIEIDPELVDLATRNAERNGYSKFVTTVVLDAAASAKDFANGGLRSGVANCVLMNPPFHAAARTNPSADTARRAAHVGDGSLLRDWIKTADRLLRASGTLTLIYRADELEDVLAALPEGLGGVTVKPIYPKPEAPAIRIIVGATKGSRQPLRLLPGLCLNDSEGNPTRQAEDVLRRGTGLDLRA
jgi:tRNA1(Val) A37 N6-methylase TrmN6